MIINGKVQHFLIKTEAHISNLQKRNSKRAGGVALDALNLQIAKELLSDADVRSADIAAKYGVPLSTVQRRKARLEESMLIKYYQVNTEELRWRTAAILVSVENGQSRKIARMLLEKHGEHIANTSLQIGHPDINVMASVFFRSSEELHALIESIRSIPDVKSAEWTELAKEVGTNKAIMFEIISST